VPLEIRNPDEFAGICRYQLCPVPERLASDEKVVRADRSSDRLEGGAELAGDLSVRLLEWQDADVSEKKMRSRSAFSLGRWLRAISYQSSYTATVDTATDSPLASGLLESAARSEVRR